MTTELCFICNEPDDPLIEFKQVRIINDDVSLLCWAHAPCLEALREEARELEKRE
jgi:hypothetical protein